MMVDQAAIRDKRNWVVGTVLARQAKARGDRPFLQFEDWPPQTYAAVDAMANRVAHGLAKLGVHHGDHVGVFLPNSLEHCYLWFGINRLGAVHVAINTGYRGRFLSHVLTNARCKVVICDPALRPRVDEILEELPEHPQVFDSLAPLLHDSALPVDAEVSYRDVATIMYTSGTTGPSKGVLMPHAHNYLLGLGIVDNLRLTEDDTYYVCLPLFHANAMFLQVYSTLIAGGRAVIVPKFGASNWIDDIRRYRCTITNTLGVMMEFILKQPARPNDADNALRVVLAVPMPPSLAPGFRARFGCQILEGFGMTEVNIPLYTPLDAPPRDGSCGKVYGRYFEVRVVDPDTDEELPPGEIGEIVVRPREPFAFSLGYHAMPEKTVEAWRNFWFHTGDAGRRDEDGYFYFVERIKDCIRRRGENISSYEIESVLMSHPAIAEAAAVAVKSEVVGGEDEVKVCLVLQPDAQVTFEALAAYCLPRMPTFAVPRYWEFLDKLPYTPTEKIQKALLRAAGVTRTTWDRLGRR
jgi:crotonobetaine/carnitine-CoA ligase